MNKLFQLKEKTGAFLHRCGISADLLTCLGLFSSLLAGILVFQGRLFDAGLALLVSGILDLLDGATARAGGIKNKFGAVLDSSFDRYGDAFILSGIIFYCIYSGRFFYAVLGMSGLWGSFVISYVRARAECLIPSCRVGFWERGERIVLLCLGLFLSNLAAALWILAFATHATVIRRLLCARSELTQEGRPGSPGRVKIQTLSRTSPAYVAVAGLIVFLVAFIRPPF